MICKLCEKPIEKYSPVLNNLKIDETHSVDICQDCAHKFTNWQGQIIAKLFPTKAMKKRFQKE